jgi:hypothetical protein
MSTETDINESIARGMDLKKALFEVRIETLDNTIQFLEQLREEEITKYRIHHKADE